MKSFEAYPLKFEPILESPVWSNNKMHNYREVADNNNYGISWEVSVHSNAANVIKNGIYKKLKLVDLINQYPQEILGNKVAVDEVLRISYIDAKEKLSVQVHPHQKHLQQNELWYILAAPKDAKIILGLKCNNEAVIKASLDDDNLMEYLNLVSVKVGEFVHIPGGLVHALTEEMVVLEIGENHDNTYRLYDYNRKRKLQVEQSLASIVYKNNYQIISENSSNQVAYHGDDFIVELIEENNYQSHANLDYYVVYTNIGEKTLLTYNSSEINIKKGESVLIPAILGSYQFIGKVKLIKSYLNKI